MLTCIYQDVDVLVKDVRNWDDLVQRVAPTEGDDVQLTWRECVLDVLVEMFPQLTRQELEVCVCMCVRRERERERKEEEEEKESESERSICE